MVFVCLVLLIPLALTNNKTKQELETLRRPATFEQRDGYFFPSGEVIRGFALNYSTFAASMVWISGLVYFGDWRFTPHKKPPRHLEDYALAVIQLDPSFYNIYDWLDATYINARLETGGVPHEDLLFLSKFLVSGLRYFPDQPDLPYSAATNFLGYSEGRADRERIIEYERGMEYFRRCLEISDCPGTSLLLLAHMRTRKQEIEASMEGREFDTTYRRKLPAEERERYVEIYKRTSDPETAEQMAKILKKEGIEPENILTAQNEELQRRREVDLPYLPIDTWSLVVNPR